MSLENLKGNVKVWVNEWEKSKTEKLKFYSISIGNKQKDGSYLNANLPVVFAKSQSEKVEKLENGTDIKINDSWLSCYKGKKDDFPKINLFINDFILISNIKVKSPKKLTEEQLKGLQKLGIATDDLT